VLDMSQGGSCDQMISATDWSNSSARRILDHFGYRGRCSARFYRRPCGSLRAAQAERRVGSPLWGRGGVTTGRLDLQSVADRTTTKTLFNPGVRGVIGSMESQSNRDRIFRRE
jgi:hypothetical protein